MFSQLPTGIISNETARTRFSFINNAKVESERVKKEQQEYIDSLSDINEGDYTHGNENE